MVKKMKFSQTKCKISIKSSCNSNSTCHLLKNKCPVSRKFTNLRTWNEIFSEWNWRTHTACQLVSTQKGSSMCQMHLSRAHTHLHGLTFRFTFESDTFTRRGDRQKMWGYVSNEFNVLTVSLIATDENKNTWKFDFFGVIFIFYVIANLVLLNGIGFFCLRLKNVCWMY